MVNGYYLLCYPSHFQRMKSKQIPILTSPNLGVENLKKITAEAKARETSWFVTNFSVNLKETTMVWRILSWIKNPVNTHQQNYFGGKSGGKNAKRCEYLFVNKKKHGQNVYLNSERLSHPTFLCSNQLFLVSRGANRPAVQTERPFGTEMSISKQQCSGSAWCNCLTSQTSFRFKVISFHIRTHSSFQKAKALETVSTKSFDLATFLNIKSLTQKLATLKSFQTRLFDVEHWGAHLCLEHRKPARTPWNMSWLKNTNVKMHLNRGYQFNLAEEKQTIKSQISTAIKQWHVFWSKRNHRNWCFVWLSIEQLHAVASVACQEKIHRHCGLETLVATNSIAEATCDPSGIWRYFFCKSPKKSKGRNIFKVLFWWWMLFSSKDPERNLVNCLGQYLVSVEPTLDFYVF